MLRGRYEPANNSSADEIGDPAEHRVDGERYQRSAVTPITHQQDGLPSNRRREMAKSVPAMMSNAPTAAIEMIGNGNGPVKRH